MAQALLDEAVESADRAHPNGRALYAMHEGAFYKAYCHEVNVADDQEHEEVWHGYPVRRALVPQQVPCRVLREFVRQGRLSRPEYRKLMGAAK